jgi:hypothetical protein
MRRAERCETGSMRVYFYDLETRAELTDHPLAAMCYCGGGPMVSHEGAYVDGTTTGVDGAAFIDGAYRRVRVTADSFPGRKVCAKIWYGPGHQAAPRGFEWRLLARGDESPVLGKRPRVGRVWVERFKAGQVA